MNTNSMDSLAFVARLTEALAWPVAAILVALMLRRPLFDLLASMTSLTFRGVKAEFRRGATRVANEAATSLLPPPNAVPAPAITPEFAELSEKNPRAAIIEAWLRVSGAALEALRAKGFPLDETRALHPAEVIEAALIERKVLTAREMAILTQLRHLRDLAAHSPAQPAPGDALQYVTTALRLVETLKRGGTPAK